MTTNEQLREWAYHLDRTGHHMLSVGDFGWWSCQACEQNGDDWTSPKDFKCVEIDTYEI